MLAVVVLFVCNGPHPYLGADHVPVRSIIQLLRVYSLTVDALPLHRALFSCRASPQQANTGAR